MTVTENGSGSQLPDADANVPLPTVLETTLSFVRRLPTQRLLDQLAHLDATPFGELQEQQPSRILAFRLLYRDHPQRDIGSLWMHAYDCEVEIMEADPTLALGQMPSLPSAPTTT